MSKATLIKENILLGLAYSFRGLVHYHHGGEHGSVQAEIELEDLRALNFDLQVAERDWVILGLSIYQTLKPSSSYTLPLTRLHLVQQDHTS